MQLESNPFTGPQTDTNFTSAASRKFTRTSANAYKNANANNDKGVLGISWLSTCDNKCSKLVMA